jgi:hypothetical protein
MVPITRETDCVPGKYCWSSRKWQLAGSLVMVVLVLACCGVGRKARLKEAAEGYFNAWKFKDYETMYGYLSEPGRERIPLSQFRRFMSLIDSGRDLYQPDDFEADYLRNVQRGGIDAFKIEEVYLTGNGRGKVKVFVKTRRDLIGESVIDPNEWADTEQGWRIDVSPGSSLYAHYMKWKQRNERSGEPEPEESTEEDRRLKLARQALAELQEKLREFYRQHRGFPVALDELPGGEHLIDPYSGSGVFRYYSDGRHFWIAASNGPDGDADIEVRKFKGFSDGYPPTDLVYDPLTGDGDLYNYGPR